MDDKEIKKDIDDAQRALNLSLARANKAGLRVDVNLLKVVTVDCKTPEKVVNCHVFREVE